MNQSTFEHEAQATREQAFRAALRTCGNKELADDVAQDVMLKLWEMHEELDGRDNMLRLGAVIARRMTIDNLRRLRSVNIDDTPHSMLPRVAPADHILEHDEVQAWLEDRMAKLPSAQSIILRLRQVEGRSNSEIATLLGIGTASVATMLSRARRELLRQLTLRNKPQT